MEFQGTKGIWEINPRALRNVKCNEITIANCSAGQSGDKEEEEIANAKLIAAAPELLKVCQNALRDVKAMNEWMVEKGHHGYTLLERDLEDVLKKALM